MEKPISIGLIDLLAHRRAWEIAAPWVEKGVQHANGELTTSDIRDMIVARKAQLWLILKRDENRFVGACTTQIIDYPKMRALRIITLGGSKMKEWQGALDETLTAYALHEDCGRLEAAGRKGFIRVLGPLGFDPAYVILVKEVKDGKSRRADDVHFNDASALIPTAVH